MNYSCRFSNSDHGGICPLKGESKYSVKTFFYDTDISKAYTTGQRAFAASKDALKSQQQHEEAAKQYAEAAKGTEDEEALRVLKLLETQHEELSKIVRSVNSPKHNTDHVQTTLEKSGKESNAATASVIAPNLDPGPTRSSTSKRPPRELRSSIASNLATARGIPSAQVRGAHRTSSPPANRSPAQASLESNIYSDRAGDRVDKEEDWSSRKGTANDVKQKGDSSAEATAGSGVAQQSPNQGDTFQKFYASFEGLFSKLSAPLVFAGFPLTQANEATVSDEITSNPQRATTTSINPDLNQIFSRAALNAVKNDQDQNAGVNDSFFVVPTGGGTMSYARMLSREERMAREQAGEATSMNAANQSPVANAQEHRESKDKANRLSQKSKRKNKTVEELEIENDSLKKLTDKLSERLHTWELTSQRQTSALQESMRLMSRHPTDSGSGGRNAGDQNQIRELETQVQSMQREIERQAKENEKLKATLKKYRDRWEQLKVGARTRRDGSNASRDRDD